MSSSVDPLTLTFTYTLIFGLMAVFYGILLHMLISNLAARFRRWRSASAARRMLDRVPDVPYLPLPDPDGAAGPTPSSSSSCVICITEYAHGERRFVMPACGHAFHRGCIAEWLRLGKNTCPICRAAAIVVGPPAGAEKVVVAAVSTAEDMV